MGTGVGDGATQLLTFLIADVRGYTAYTQANGDEAAARLAAAFAEIVREGVEAHGGRVIELRGDEALAVFASARDALRASVDVQEALVDEVERHPELPLRAGIGLDAGEAVPVEGGYRGGALNLAARLCSQAGPGEILASPGVTHLARAVSDVRLVARDALTLKGLPEPVPVFAVTREAGEADALRRRLDEAAGSEPPHTRVEVPQALSTSTPIATGREAVARRVRWAWRQARRGAGGIIVIDGERGMGKTRMAAEAAFLAAHDGASVLHVGRGDPPVAIDGAEGPALVVVDDAAVAADLLRSEADRRERIAGRELLVIVTAELDGIASASPSIGRIVLEPLGADAVAEIVAMHAGGDARGAPIAAILQASAGVPARVHELAAGWVRDEATRRLGEAAARAAVGRSDLRVLEAEVATNVIDLQLARERAELFGSPTETTIDGSKESPFKGLAPFDVDDVEVFFGRERLVADIVGKLAGSTFLAVVGPSGSGKSSAVRAGLLPALAVGALPGSDGWLRVVVRPGNHPLRALDRAVWAALPDDLRQEMESVELPLRELRDHLGDDRRVVVVIDQFEEVFTHADEDERNAFVRALVEAADDPRGVAVVVLCLRADYYGRCSGYPRLAELTGSSHVLVGQMTETEYRRAIEGPARRAGLSVEPALVDALVGEVIDEPGALPLLSAALLELWQSREDRTLTLAAYETTGGVHGAVGRLAEDAYASLDVDEQEATRAVMLRLAGPGEGDAIVRRRVQLGEFDVEQNPRVARVLEVFTDARLLTVGDGTVEVAHEALLREWPRLAAWLDDDRAGMRLRAHIGVAAKEWGQADRDPGELYRGARLTSAVDWMGDHSLELNELEREFLGESRSAAEEESQRQRTINHRLRALLVGAVALLAVALVAGVLAVAQRAKADRSATTATASRLGAQAVIEDDLDTSLLLAAQARAIDDSIETKSSLLATLLRAPAAIRVMPGTGNRLLEIHQSQDGSVFVTVDNVGQVGVYDTASMERVRVLSPPPFFGGDLSPDGTTIIGQAESGGYLAISVADGTSRTMPLAQGRFPFGTNVAFHPDGDSFISLERRCPPPPDPCDAAPTFLVRRAVDDGAELAAAPVPITSEEPSVAWSPNGDVVVIVDGEDLRVLDPASLTTTAFYPGSVAWPFDVAEDGRSLAFGRRDGEVATIDLGTGEVRAFEGRHGAAVQGVGYAPDGSLVTTSDDREVFVWDVARRTISEKLEGHAGRVFGPAFDADGSTAFTVGLDGRVIAWDLTSERRIGTRFSFAPDGALCCPPPGTDAAPEASPDGRTIAYQTGDGQVVLVDAATHEMIAQHDPWSNARLEELRAGDPALADFQRGFVSDFAFSDDGRWLAVSGAVPEVVIYDAHSGDPVRRIAASKMGWVNGLSFAPDGSLVTANDDGTLAIWDATTGSLVDRLTVFPESTSPDDYPGAIYSPRISPDGRRLAFVTNPAPFDAFSVRVVDLAEHREVWRREVGAMYAVVDWAPDARSIAVGHFQDGTLSIHDAETGALRAQPINVNAGWVLSIDHADSRHLWVTAGSDGTVRLFDDETLAQVGSNIPAVDNQFTTATVTDDGDAMVVVSMAGMGWRWDLDPDRWTSQACAVAARSLTVREWHQFLPSLTYDPTCRRGSGTG